jgi:hypothetical protein
MDGYRKKNKKQNKKLIYKVAITKLFIYIKTIKKKQNRESIDRGIKKDIYICLQIVLKQSIIMNQTGFF